MNRVLLRRVNRRLASESAVNVALLALAAAMLAGCGAGTPETPASDGSLTPAAEVSVTAELPGTAGPGPEPGTPSPTASATAAPTEVSAPATPASEASALPAPTPVPRWEVEFALQGGFLGLNDVLLVMSDGRAFVGRPGPLAPLSNPVPTAALSALLEREGFFLDVQVSDSGFCADCFGYSIRIRAPDGSEAVIEVDDGGLGRSGPLRELVELLRSILVAALG